MVWRLVIQWVIVAVVVCTRFFLNLFSRQGKRLRCWGRKIGIRFRICRRCKWSAEKICVISSRGVRKWGCDIMEIIHSCSVVGIGECVGVIVIDQLAGAVVEGDTSPTTCFAGKMVYPPDDTCGYCKFREALSANQVSSDEVEKFLRAL